MSFNELYNGIFSASAASTFSEEMDLRVPQDAISPKLAEVLSVWAEACKNLQQQGVPKPENHHTPWRDKEDDEMIARRKAEIAREVERRRARGQVQ